MGKKYRVYLCAQCFESRSADAQSPALRRYWLVNIIFKVVSHPGYHLVMEKCKN